MNVLSVSNLETTYPSDAGPVAAVRGVSFSVARGEVFGILGASGSGKSTLALSILRLLPPDARIGAGSSILFEGQELTALPEKAMRGLRGRRLAMIFQDPKAALDPVMTVGRQIAEGLRAHRTLSRREARLQTLALLRLVRMPDPAKRIDAYPHELSGGMRQRVMIAIALACGPSLVVADEPTSALDVTIESQILRLLAALKDDRGLAVILISHDLRVLQSMAVSAGVMAGGWMVERAPAAELFRHPFHPYTRALMESAATLKHGSRSEELPAGPVCDGERTGGGPRCPFSVRCPVRTEDCAETMPPVVEVRPSHFVMCARRP